MQRQSTSKTTTLNYKRMERQPTSSSNTQEKAGNEMPPRTMADITPLEPPIDSFISSPERSDMGTKSTGKSETLASLQTHTPPETPELPHVSTIAANVGDDPPLYPDSPIRDRTRSLSPLIRADSVTRRLDKTINDNRHELSYERYHDNSYDLHRQSQPTTYPAILGIKDAQAALDYHRNCVEEQRRWRSEVVRLPPPTRSARGSRRDATSTQQLSRLNRSSGVTKPRSVSPRPMAKPSTTTTNTASASSPRQRRVSAPKKRVAKAKAASEGPSESSQGQKKHTRAAPTKTVSNQEWREIEDYAPPLSSLDGKTHEVKWDGTNKDIRDEKDFEYLHPLEAKWASTLRLEPRQYLACKRLIFKHKLAYVRDKKPFTKTAAQNAAKLDVNKLSRLHMAFSAVGWFEDAWFQQFL